MRGKFLTAEDAALVGKLGHYEGDGWPQRYAWPGGDEPIGLVRGIVETGRARADDIRGKALRSHRDQPLERHLRPATPPSIASSTTRPFLR